jgi:hypothetical protein
MTREIQHTNEIFYRCKHINSVNINITDDFINENMSLRSIPSLMSYMLIISSVIFIPTNVVMNYYHHSLKIKVTNICHKIQWWVL